MKAAPRPYVRPMKGWWRRDPFFVRYMVREATAVGVAVYALLLAAGLVCAARGPQAWDAWRAVVQSPGGIALDLLLFACMVEHARSWFAIMPKTMPRLFRGDRPVPGEWITRVGWAASVVANVLAWLVVRWWLA